MQLITKSSRAYPKPYAQHHQHIPLPNIYQHHHILSQYMCLNQVPSCTIYQPIPSTMYQNKCINHAPNLYHQPCTNHVHQTCTTTGALTMHQTCIINHVPTTYINHVPTMYINHVHAHQFVPTMC
jgi:hypothetical protein